MIDPHGGQLVNRLASGEKAAELEAEACELLVIQVNPFEVSDLEMLAIGAFSPREATFHALVRKNIGCSYFIVGRHHAGMASQKTWGVSKQSRMMLSGTQVRAVLRESGRLSLEFTRPEVAAVLHQAFGQQQMEGAGCS